jgi:hypothetical protein
MPNSTIGPVTGQIRINTANTFDMFDGSKWINIEDSESYEEKLNRLCAKHPALKEARDKFETLRGLLWE